MDAYLRRAVASLSVCAELSLVDRIVCCSYKCKVVAHCMCCVSVGNCGVDRSSEVVMIVKLIVDVSSPAN